MNRLSIIFATLLSVLLFVVGASSVFAVASQKVQQAADDVQTSVDELLTVKDTELSEEGRLIGELDARKKVLQQVLDLSLKEIEDLSTKLVAFKDLETSDLELRDRFSETLQTYLLSYQDFQKQLEAAITLDSVKELAKTIKDWREGIYDPTVKEVADFIIVLQGEDFLGVALTRLQKISIDIQKLEKAGFLESGRFNEALKTATANLESANTSFSEAHSLVLLKNTPQPEASDESNKQLEIPLDNVSSQPLQSLPPELDEPEISQPTPDVSSSLEDESLTPPQPTPRDFVQRGLNQIKVTYGVFIEISTSVKKALNL